jgi:hypothetical protein
MTRTATLSSIYVSSFPHLSFSAFFPYLAVFKKLSCFGMPDRGVETSVSSSWPIQKTRVRVIDDRSDELALKIT